MAVLLCTMALAIALPAGAQSQGSGNMQGASGNALSLEEGLLGKSVRTRNGEGVGEVEDVIFTRQGRISHVLVDVGGFLGMGEKTVALNLNQLRFDNEEYALFNGTKTELEEMQEVDLWAFRPSYRGYYGPGRAPYGETYGYRPYYGYGPGRGYGPGYGPGGYPPPEVRSQDERFPQGQASRQPQQREYYRDSRQGRGEMRQGAQQGQMQRGMSRGISGDFLLGSPVFNERNENLGDIEDLVIDPSTRRVTHAVIEVGGVLGIGGKEVVVPFNQLKHVGPYALMYRGTQEQLEQMPEYQVSEGGRVSMAEFGRQQSPRAGGQGRSPNESQQWQGQYQQ